MQPKLLMRAEILPVRVLRGRPFIRTSQLSAKTMPYLSPAHNPYCLIAAMVVLAESTHTTSTVSCLWNNNSKANHHRGWNEVAETPRCQDSVQQLASDVKLFRHTEYVLWQFLSGCKLRPLLWKKQVFPSRNLSAEYAQELLHSGKSIISRCLQNLLKMAFVRRVWLTSQ